MRILEQINIEAILSRALRGDEDAIEKAIDAEVDYWGTFVGFGQAERAWAQAPRVQE